AVACRRRKSCKVAVIHRSRRDKRNQVRWILSESRSLITPEKEQFVLYDGPAGRSTELVALDRVASGSKEVPRVEFSITNEFEKITMKFIRTGLSNEANGPCRFGATRCSPGARLDFKFLKSIREWCGHVPIALWIVVKRAVQSETHSGVQSSGDRETGFC